MATAFFAALVITWPKVNLLVAPYTKAIFVFINLI